MLKRRGKELNGRWGIKRYSRKLRMRRRKRTSRRNLYSQWKRRRKWPSVTITKDQGNVKSRQANNGLNRKDRRKTPKHRSCPRKKTSLNKLFSQWKRHRKWLNAKDQRNEKSPQANKGLKRNYRRKTLKNCNRPKQLCLNPWNHLWNQKTHQRQKTPTRSSSYLRKTSLRNPHPNNRSKNVAQSTSQNCLKSSHLPQKGQKAWSLKRQPSSSSPLSEPESTKTSQKSCKNTNQLNKRL